MPRGLFRKITPKRETVHNHWALKPFRPLLVDPRLYSLQRRTVTPAFGAGLAIGFIPLPIHLPLAALIGIICRINVPTVMLASLITNPFTIVPAYYLAYRVGVLVTGAPEHPFQFRMSWDWVQHGLGPVWKPFLIGCGLTGTLVGLIGYGVLDIIWRYSVRKRYRERGGANTR